MTKQTDRITAKRVVVREGQVVDADSPATAAKVTEQIARARAQSERRREVWGSDNRDQIVRLARSFPTIQHAEGLDPWDPIAFLEWSLGPTCSAAWHASMFVLSVWGDRDWARVARQEGLIGEAPDVERAAESARNWTFRATAAFAVWDAQHREAFRAWCRLPFFP